MARLKTVGSPRISPDGTRVAYTVTEADLDENRFLSTLWMVDWDGGNRRRLVERTDVGMLRWSPDGKRLAFFSRRDGTLRIWLVSVPDGGLWPLPIHGQGHGPLATHRYYSGLGWSPDGKHLVFAAQGLEDPSDPLLWKDWYRTEGFGNTRRRVHIWVVDSEGGKPLRITDGDYHHGQPSFSPDGAKLLFMANRSEREEEIVSSTNENYDVWIVSALGGPARRLTSNVGPDLDPVWSPDGRHVAYASVPYQGSHGDVFRLSVIEVASGEERSLTGPTSFDYSASIEPGLWTDHGLFFTAGVRAEAHAFLASLDGGMPSSLTSGERVVGSVSVSADGGRMALLVEDPSHPAEVWAAAGDGSGLRRLTDVHAELDAASIASTELVRWRSTDGVEVEGILTKPLGFRPDLKYPLVVRPHGGPHGAVRLQFSAETQVYASAGYLVFAPNFRGSSGYGQRFLDADRGNLGGGDYEDLMSGVDHLIGQGYVDSEKLAITGTSYGGFMTAWAIGHTDRFKAAMAGAPVVNVQSFFGTTDIPSWVTWEFYGPPWKYPDRIRAYSPISYIQYAKTPTLVTHGADDVRVPLSQGLELYHSLLALGVPTEMVIYPGEQHGFRRPLHQMDRLQRTLDWFARFLDIRSTSSE
jgi:dipeptidyl aminopeptidase/acylaminoacyl peptidase